MAVSADLYRKSTPSVSWASIWAWVSSWLPWVSKPPMWEHAETRGVADRLVVVIGSDFGRTNYYNEQEGKDHWPIGSYVVMEKNQHWTDRAVGETDGLHFAHRINPATLRRDDANGTIIHPRHVHKALRRYLGIEQSPATNRFRINHTEDFAFFG